MYQQIIAVQQQSQRQIGAAQEQSQRLFEQLATDANLDRKTLTEVAEKLAQWAPAKIKDIGDKPSAVHVGRFLSKMTTDDDPEAFLLTFERIAEREGWPQTKWAGLIAPFVSGESLKAYYDLETAEAGDYEVNREILARLVTLAVRAQLVHSWFFQDRRCLI